MSEPVGGQAVLDGVMMRHAGRWSLATRGADGSIRVSVDATPAWSRRWGRVPLLRGIAALAETLVLGSRATIRASRRRTGARGARPGEIVSVLLGATLAVAVFGLLPTWIAHGVTAGGWVFHLTETVLRIAVLVGYLALLGRHPEIATVWGYHGAEHQAVHAREADEALSVEAVLRHPRQHPRCGTTFLLLVVVLAIGVHAVIGEPSLPFLLLSRVAALPVIAALAYEVIRVAGRPDAPGAARLMAVPGLWLQSLTTREPDAGQVEVALAALRAVTDPDATGSDPSPEAPGVA